MHRLTAASLLVLAAAARGEPRFVNGFSVHYMSPALTQPLQLPFTVTPGNALIVALGASSRGNAVSDNHGDTYGIAGINEDNPNGVEPISATIYWVPAATGGMTTLQLTNNTNRLEVTALEYSGLESVAGFTTQFSGAGSPSTGELDAGVAGALMLTWVRCAGSVADGGAGFTPRSSDSWIVERVGGPYRYDAQCTGDLPWVVETALFRPAPEPPDSGSLDSVQFRQVGCGCSGVGGPVTLALLSAARLCVPRGRRRRSRTASPAAPGAAERCGCSPAD